MMKKKSRLTSKVTGTEISVKSVTANLASSGLLDKRVMNAQTANNKHLRSIVPTATMLNVDTEEQSFLLKCELGSYIIELASQYHEKAKMTGPAVAKCLLDCIITVLEK